MVDTVARRSHDEGRAWSRLPALSDEERELIRGKADFMGLNYYSSAYAEPADPVLLEPSEANDRWVKTTVSESWPQAKSPWLRSVPAGLRAMLK